MAPLPDTDTLITGAVRSPDKEVVSSLSDAARSASPTRQEVEWKGGSLLESHYREGFGLVNSLPGLAAVLHAVC